MKDVALILISLGIILLGAEVFTNGIEWLGKMLNLSEGAVGSILAAVGTALPETMVPVIAFLGSSTKVAGTEIGIGAILGAPFMLSTLALFISGLAVLIFRRSNRPLKIDPSVIERDLSFFLLVYSIAVFASFLPFRYLKVGVVIILSLIYILYVIRTLKKSRRNDEPKNLDLLYFARNKEYPTLNIVLVQILLALFIIVVGAHNFVGAINSVALSTGIPAFVLALVITPVATELPEKFNSVIWLKKEKDTLALGNITGAMVFQSSVIPALGIAFTTWELTSLALISGALALGSCSILYLMLKRNKVILPSNLLLGGGVYLLFILILLRFPQFH